jgi:hypothetical protein
VGFEGEVAILIVPLLVNSQVVMLKIEDSD